MVSKESKNGREIFVALDAHSIIHRAFHSYPPTLETTDGLQVNAVYGFTVMFLKVLKMFEPKYIVCAFDTPKPTFRHAQYTAYKGTRKPTDQSLLDQFPVVEEVVRSFNVPILKREGYEADDLIGTLAEYVQEGKWSNSNVQLCVVTGDNDLLQLVDEKVSVLLPKRTFKTLREFSREDVYEKLGVYPEQVVDYKTISGDPSDNIPGIVGVGSKTAAKLLEEYDSIEGIYSNLNELSPRLKRLFEEGIEQASLSKELVKICKDVDIMLDLEACLQDDFNEYEVLEKFAELEFKSLAKQIPTSLKKKSQVSFSTEQFDLFDDVSQEDLVPREIDDEALSEVLKGVKKITGVFALENEIYSKEKWLMLRIENTQGKSLEISLKADESEKKILEIFKNSKDAEIYFYGWENFVAEFSKLPKFEKVYDIALLAHIENSGLRDYTISNLAFTYITKNLPEKLDPDNCKKALDSVGDIFEKISKELKEREISKDLLGEKVDFLEFNTKVETSLSFALADMERRGVLFNKELLEKLHSDLKEDIDRVVKEIYESVGHEFNINSTKQLSDILFNELGLTPVTKTKTLFSTREDVLRKLEGHHPVVSKILEYRQKTKLMSNYVHVYKIELGERERLGKELSIHTDFKQTGTTSGRLSSVNPNMQTLPSGNELSERLKEIFIPREGFVFLSVDYSQIDLRVMGHLSEDQVLISDFKEKKDVHLSTASRILDKPESEITSAERKVGKTINFGIIYGLTSYGLSQSLKISVEDAEKYIKEYFENYSGIAQYINWMTKDVQSKRYVESILGRRRYVSGVNSRNLRVQKAAIREAINMPVQGGSADIMKLAMIEAFNLIKEKYEGDVFMVLQIHDEILFEVKKEVLEDFKKEIKGLMENGINLKVPLEVNLGVGENMAELK